MQSTRPSAVIDMHIHLGSLLLGDDFLEAYDTLEQKNRLQAAGLSKAVALELAWGDEYLRLREKLAPAEGFFELFPSVDIARVEDPDFDGLVYRTLRDYKADGVKGLKLWKNITQALRDKNGKVIPVDDVRFDPIWAYSAEFALPIVFHHGGQPAYFQPATPDNPLYQDMLEHPEWCFNQPEMPSFEAHMAMQENILARNPKMQLVLAHVTAAVADLDRVARWLDRYPNMFVDIAARIVQLARQGEKAREFIIKYADRILFGTDYSPKDGDACGFYQKYFRFLETREPLQSPFENTAGTTLTGLDLPAEVLEKVYLGNTRDIFGLVL